MQMQHAKYLNPERFELGTTLSYPSWSITMEVVQILSEIGKHTLLLNMHAQKCLSRTLS